jgi:TP901 family phage tail tape measure protein
MAVKVGNVIVNFKTNLAAFETDIKKASRSLKSMGRDFSTAGKSLTTTLTVPIVAAGVAFGKFANDIDKGMDTIRAGTGAAGKVLTALGDNMRSVMRRVPQDVAQVSTAIADLNTRLGLTGKPLEDMAEQLLNLSRITNTDVAGNIAAATRVFGQWNVAADDQAKALDRLFVASQSSGIGIDKLMSGVVTFGAQLKSFGFSLDESAALLAQWEKAGINAEGALSGLSMGLGKFAKAGKDPAQGLKELQERMDAAGSEADAMKLAIEAFGTRSGAVLGRAMIEGRMNVDDFAKAMMESSETINSAAKDAMSFGEKMSLLGNRVKLAAEPIGNSLLKAFDSLVPYLEKGLVFVEHLAKMFAGLPKPVKAAIVVIGGLTAAIGPALMLVGSMATGIAALLPWLAKLALGLKSCTLALGPWSIALAAVTVAVVAYSDEIATAIEKMARFLGLAEKMPGVVKANADKYKEVAEALHVSDYTLESFMGTNKRALVVFGQNRDKIKDLWREVEQGKISQTEYEMALNDMLTAGRKAPGVLEEIKKAFGSLNVEVDTASDALAAFNASYFDSFKGAENIPRAPWDRRIIDLELYLGKVQELSLAESAALKAREAVDVPLMDPILLELSGEGVEGFVKQAVDGADEIIASFDDLRRAAEDGTWRLNEYLAKAREALADGTGGFDEIAATALGGYLSGYENVLTGVADSFGNFFDYLAYGFARAIAFSDDFGEALKDIGRNAVGMLISSLVRLGIQWALNKAIMSAADKGVLAENAAQAAATATAWAPAAALASLATLGANAAPASAAIGMTSAVSMGVAATSRLGGFKEGGFTGWGSKDEVAGFVHGQEFVMNERATKEYLPLLQAMNSPAPINNRYETMPVARALSQPSINISVANYGSSKQFTVEQIDESNIRIIARDEAYNVLSQRGPEVIAADLAYANSRTSKALARHTTARRGDR